MRLANNKRVSRRMIYRTNGHLAFCRLVVSLRRRGREIKNSRIVIISLEDGRADGLHSGNIFISLLKRFGGWIRLIQRHMARCCLEKFTLHLV